MAEVVAALAGGPMTRAQLRERVERIGVRTEGQAHVHILLAATLRGLIVRGPMVGADHAYVLTRDWLGAPPRLPDREVMLAELARRYLAGHGPADDRDLAKWSGLSLGDARRGLSAVSGLLAGRDDGLASLAGADGPDAGLPPPRLHGPFDPLLHGWMDRSFVLGSTKGIVTSNGIFRPFALVNGPCRGDLVAGRGQDQAGPVRAAAGGRRGRAGRRRGRGAGLPGPATAPGVTPGAVAGGCGATPPRCPGGPGRRRRPAAAP